MHKLISFFLDRLNDIEHFLNFICAFFILALSLYWIETSIKAEWTWLNFLKPAMDNIRNVSDSILPLPLDNLIEKFNSEFIVSIALIVIIMVLIKFIFEKMDLLRVHYDKMHIAQKLSAEKRFNKKLVNSIEKEQKQISKYMILINTKIKKKFSHKEINVDIDEQNKLMNEFISSKTGVTYQNFNNGFLYYFDDFDHIDHVLNVLFKVIESSAPLDYAICIQIGIDLKPIKRLADLENFGKIIMLSDTLLRYKCNKGHMYQTECTGVYQKPEGTLEVHEFQKMSI